MADVATVSTLVNLKLDAKTVEDVANGDNTTIVTSRLGESINSLAKALKKLEDNGFVGNAMYVDTTAGIAATSNGQLFTIPATDAEYSLEIWKNNSGVAEDTGKRVPDGKRIPVILTGYSYSTVDAPKDVVIDISSKGYSNAPEAKVAMKTNWPCSVKSVTSTSVTVAIGSYGDDDTADFDLWLVSND